MPKKTSSPSYSAFMYSHLKDLAGGRVYPLVAPEGTKTPCIVWSLISSRGYPTQHHKISIKRHLIQIDVYGTDYDEVNDIAHQITERLLTDRRVLEQTEREMYESATGLFRKMKEIVLWL